MRGFLTPSVKPIPSDTQKAFAALARGRRSKLAKVAKTTLVKADQWAHGGAATSDVSTALEQALKVLTDKAAKKKKA
jgi:hypothetical protein